VDRAGLPRPLGWVDGLTEHDGAWLLWGWALPARGSAFDSIRVRRKSGESLAERAVRPELAEAAPWVRRASGGGFFAAVRPDADAGRIEVVCRRRERAVAAFATTYLPAERDPGPLPPEGLSRRVSGLSGEAFRLSGLQAFTDMWDAATRHGPGGARLRVLDWGCGCGRLARRLTRLDDVDLIGCDIDAEAVEWCAAHIDGRFTRTDPNPPLPYRDGEMDVVVASSVLTHLARLDQHAWLREIARVLAPAGLLIASAAGETAFLRSVPRPARLGPPGSILHRAAAERRRRALRRAGIVDEQPDDWLDGIAPPGYYRHVYQSREHTEREWGAAGLDVVDYVERGYHGHQDLVVLTKRA
jgi:SAM-dependent methyltransferase